MIGVLVCGEGTNLQALLDEGLPIAAVASNNTKAKALDRAVAAGIEAGAFPETEFESREARDTAMADFLAERGVDLVVCAGYMRLLTKPFLDRFRAGSSTRTPRRCRTSRARPRSRTCSPRACPRPLRPSTTSTKGSTPAPVIAAERVPVHPGDTADTLRERVQAVEHRLLPAAVRQLCER